MYKTYKSGISKHFDFMILDAICVELAYILAFVIRHGTNPFTNSSYRNVGLFLILLEILCCIFLESHKDILKRGYFREFREVLKKNTVMLLIFFGYAFILHSGNIFSRITFFLTWALANLLMYGAHLLWKRYIRFYMRCNRKARQVVLVSRRKTVKETLQKLQLDEVCNYMVVGLILDGEGVKEKSINGVPVLGCLGIAMDKIRSMVVDEVLIDLPASADEETKRIVEQCYDRGITTHIYIHPMGHVGGMKVVERMGSCTVVTNSIKVASMKNVLAKRFMDIAGGIVGVLIMAISMILVVPGIMIQSPGPIFFVQERVGKNGRRFKLYKFRSMCVDAELQKKSLLAQNEMEGFMFKMKEDPRVFGFGKFMRKTSIDELPQFINVLKGDMSLVGTRPPTVEEYQQYEARHMKRLASKPGLTGLWQVSGRSAVTDFEQVVELDAKYIEESNIGLDIKIILKTIWVVLTGKGSE